MAQENSKKGSNDKICVNCHSPEGSGGAPKLSACARCGLVLYCSRDCQRAHWKSNHKQHCVAKADRVPQPLVCSDGVEQADAAASGEECSICLDPLSRAPGTTLQCTHVFHSKCVEELRKFGVKQTCPLCRTPLPAGPEQTNEEATLRYMGVIRLVKQGKASWSKLPAEAQSEMDAAVSGWRAAADQGFAAAQGNLGYLYEEGHGVKQSDAEAVKWWKKAVEQGNAGAQFSLGLMFVEGRGVARSDAKAAQLYRKAAEQGHSMAQCNLGNLCMSGRGVALSYKEAAKWFKMAADQGNAKAQYSLGNLYEEGRGLKQSDAEALRLWKSAAEQGHAMAQCNLGSLIECGRGAAQNYELAAKWYSRAAAQGLAQAQCNMGRVCLHGRGVKQSEGEAVRWFKKAAAQGNEKAQYNLACLFQQGIGRGR